VINNSNKVVLIQLKVHASSRSPCMGD